MGNKNLVYAQSKFYKQLVAIEASLLKNSCYCLASFGAAWQRFCLAICYTEFGRPPKNGMWPIDYYTFEIILNDIRKSNHKSLYSNNVVLLKALAPIVRELICYNHPFAVMWLILLEQMLDRGVVGRLNSDPHNFNNAIAVKLKSTQKAQATGAYLVAQSAYHNWCQYKSFSQIPPKSKKAKRLMVLFAPVWGIIWLAGKFIRWLRPRNVVRDDVNNKSAVSVYSTGVTYTAMLTQVLASSRIDRVRANIAAENHGKSFDRNTASLPLLHQLAAALFVPTMQMVEQSEVVMSVDGRPPPT